MVHIILGAALGRGGDRLGRLALGADEQDAAAASRDFAQRDQRLVQQRHGLGEVEDMDVVARAIDVGRHFRIPALLAVAEMGAGFEQSGAWKILAKPYDQSPLPVGQTRGLSLLRGHRTGTAEHPAETHPRVRDGGAYKGRAPA